MRTQLLALMLAALPLAAAPAPWTAVEEPDLAERVKAAKPLPVEDVCTPVRSVRRGELLVVPNPGGKTLDFLQIYFAQYGGPNTIVVMDLGSGEVKNIELPRGLNFHLCPRVVAPNGKLYISCLEGMKQEICVYDPATNELATKALPMPEELRGETHPLVLGTDGKVYAVGAHPTNAACAAQIDPETGKVTSYGAIGPSHSPSGCWGYSAAADDRYVYIASGKVPWYLVAYDRQTGKSETLVTTENVDGYVSVGQGRYGCTGSASKVVGTDGARVDYWLTQGKAIPKREKNEKPPWPEPAAPAPWVAMPPLPEVGDTLATPGSDGKAELWFRAAEARAAAPKEPPAGATPEELGWRVFRYTVPTYPMSAYRLAELPDGRLLGTAGAYEGSFLFDPATGAAQHPGKISLSHYSTAILDGLVYMSGYPSSGLFVYDPSKPWTANTAQPNGKLLDEEAPASNPRRITYLNKYAGTHKMYAAAVGADGRVYFGGQWVRNGQAGGLAWYDPKAQQAGGFWEPFSNYQVDFMTAAGDGRFVVVSTHRVLDTLLNKPKPEQGRLFIFDTTTGKIARGLDPVLATKGAGLIVGVGGTRLLGWNESPDDPQSSILYGVDAATGEVQFRRTLPFPLPVAIGSNQQEAFDYRLGPDGKVWTFLGGALVRIDPRDTSIEVLGKVPGGRLAFSGKDLYLASSPALRRVHGMVGQ